MGTRFNIKARLANLAKTSKDVIAELEKWGVKTNAAEFSAAINKTFTYKKCDLICETADKIITKWESERMQ